MRPKLYAHQFSSYCQKALIALHENATPFEFRLLSPHEEARPYRPLFPLGAPDRD
jgi:glutathione S-transferase